MGREWFPELQDIGNGINQLLYVDYCNRHTLFIPLICIPFIHVISLFLSSLSFYLSLTHSFNPFFQNCDIVIKSRSEFVSVDDDEKSKTEYDESQEEDEDVPEKGEDVPQADGDVQQLQDQNPHAKDGDEPNQQELPLNEQPPQKKCKLEEKKEEHDVPSAIVARMEAASNRREIAGDYLRGSQAKNVSFCFEMLHV
jgi:hypothetical protein